MQMPRMQRQPGEEPALDETSNCPFPCLLSLDYCRGDDWTLQAVRLFTLLSSHFKWADVSGVMQSLFHVESSK